MGAINEIITSAIEIMTLPVLILLFAVLLYIYGSFCLLKWCLTSNHRLNSTGYRRRNIPDKKTSRSKSKKATSVLVKLKDTTIKDTGTAQLQIFNSCGPKSSTTLYNIESDSNQKMEYQREEENFITVLSKRERRSLQHKKNQQQKKDEEQQLKNQPEQKQQQHHKLLQNQNECPTVNNIVVTPIKPIFAENNAWAKALQIKDDDKAKILQAEQKITEIVCVDKQKHIEKEQELEKQHKLKKQQNNQEKRLQNNQKKQEKPSKPEDKRQQHNSKQEKEPEKQCDDAMNEKRCKNHDTIIEELREENEKLRMRYESSRNNWTDIEFKTVLEGVCAEIEIKRLDAIKSLLEKHQTALDELQIKHEAEIKGLHLFYKTRLNDLHLDHGLAIRAIHTNHAIEVKDLRNINYGQNQRHGTAMQSLRDVYDKISKEHQYEVRKYENTIKDQEIRIKTLIEEKELWAQEKLVRELSEKNIDQHHITIEAQITYDHDDKDDDIRIATIADDDTVDTIDMLNSQDLMLNNTTVDYNQIIDDTEQKLSQLHGYTSSNDSDCSSHTEDLLQQLNNVEVDALQSNACNSQKSHD